MRPGLKKQIQFIINMPDFITTLLDRLKTHVVFITHYNKTNDKIVCKPYTLQPDVVQNLITSHTDTHICVYDTLVERMTMIGHDKIVDMSIHFSDDLEMNKRQGADYKEFCKFREEWDHTCGCCHDHEHAIEVMCDVDLPDGLHPLMCVFKHELSVKEIVADELSVEKLEQAKQHWTDIIRLKRSEAFKELDDLESQAENDDEQQDVQDIKQMFRDVPQDLDLTDCKSIKDLYDVWPPLLLPMPDELQNITWECFSPDEMTLMGDVHDILVQIEDVDTLTQLFEELQQDSIDPQALQAIESRIEQLQQ